MKCLVLFGADGIAQGIAEDGINLDRFGLRGGRGVVGHHHEDQTRTIIPLKLFIPPQKRVYNLPHLRPVVEGLRRDLLYAEQG